MSDSYPPPPPPPGPEGQGTPPPPPPSSDAAAVPAPPPAAPPTPPAYGGYGAGMPPAASVPGQLGPVGQVRSTGVAILLAIVTLGIYTYYWYYKVHEEMKQHTGTGLGGGMALLLTLGGSLCLGGLPNLVIPFLTSGEVGAMYERQGRPKPVSGQTGLWYTPGFLLLVLPIVWFVKTNGALNDYWKSMGAQG